jgi:hypothetical protein
MKKTLSILLLTFMFFALILAACSVFGSQSSNSTSGGNFSNSGNNTTPLPLATQLLIGTFKLEGTPNAVTAEEAAKLLPLWQVYKDLSSSTSAAPQEVEALASQIQSTMTPEQTQAITDMKLTRRDMFDVMQKLGLVTGSSGTPRANSTPRAGGNGGFPGGGGGGGFPGGGGGGGQNLSPQQLATLQARRAQNGASGGQFNRIPAPLFDALIKLLQTKK